TFVLYAREYRIAETRRRGDRSLKSDVLGRAWAGIDADDRTWMWNGGVIGVPGRVAGVMDRTLEAFDQLRAASTHFAVEQLAYSIVFPRFGPVEEGRQWFDHYWANRSWFDRRIDRFLSELQSRENLVCRL